MDGEPDHVHLLINYPPKLAISSLVNSLKGVSSRLLRCGGAPISVIRQYIEQQQTPGQVENRALYPRPEGRGFTAHRISLEIIYTSMDIIVLCPVHAPSHPQHQSIRALQTIMRLSLSHLSYAKKIELISSGAILRIK